MPKRLTHEIERICIICGNQFVATPERNSKCCSPDCERVRNTNYHRRYSGFGLPEKAVIEYDPSDFPMSLGYEICRLEFQHMLDAGSFTPGTILSSNGKRFIVRGEIKQTIEEL